MIQEYTDYLLYVAFGILMLSTAGLTIYSFYVDAKTKARKKNRKLRKKLALDKG